MAITRKQIAVVHLAGKQLGLDDDLYRAVLYHRGNGVTSAADLTPEGFKGVMDYFNACGFRSDWMKRTYGNRPGMASPNQIDLIRKLWRQWSGEDNEKDLNLWLDRSFRVSALRFLTPEIAGKAITGLRAMAGRKAAPRTAPKKRSGK